MLLEEFIRGRNAASGPLAAYNKLVWLHRHLGAPICSEGITRPVHQAGEEGGMKELAQASALPPELLIDLERIAGEMICEDSWGAIAVCVALSLAWSLMRLVHVNRSRITHYSEDSLWCRAFRGKTRKDGARRPFRWVLVRRGPAGIDIGGHILRKWTQFSKAAGKPLEYLCLDASSGAM